ncbi:MAG: transporter substrate-binding domain-containing protein, partial [Oligoflexia bacterium]|nr:transporter substrate-binding domain-containing protein [Oligoflexia bacterium]
MRVFKVFSASSIITITITITIMAFLGFGPRAAFANNPEKASEKASEEASIAWEDTLKPPYLMMDSGQKLYGIAVDIIEEIFKRKKIKVQHKIFPWKRCLQEIEKRQVDMVPNASYKDDRAKYANYTKPLYSTHLMFFYLKKKFLTPPAISTMEEIKKFRIGGIAGFNYEHYEGNISIDVGSATRDSLVAKLKSERLDFAIEQKEVMLNLKKDGKLDLEGIGMVS